MASNVLDFLLIFGQWLELGGGGYGWLKVVIGYQWHQQFPSSGVGKGWWWWLVGMDWYLFEFFFFFFKLKTEISKGIRLDFI